MLNLTDYKSFKIIELLKFDFKEFQEDLAPLFISKQKTTLHNFSFLVAKK
jgi:hypothetical protein